MNKKLQKLKWNKLELPEIWSDSCSNLSNVADISDDSEFEGGSSSNGSFEEQKQDEHEQKEYMCDRGHIMEHRVAENSILGITCRVCTNKIVAGEGYKFCKADNYKYHDECTSYLKEYTKNTQVSKDIEKFREFIAFWQGETNPNEKKTHVKNLIHYLQDEGHRNIAICMLHEK